MNHIPVVEIGGTARARGAAHGEALRALILERDARWREYLGMRSGRTAEQFIDSFLGSTRFLPAIERWAPDLLPEVRGIADGCGLPYERILAAQFMDEEWWFTSRLPNPHHCSSLAAAAPETGRALAAQTMDLPTWTEGFQALLRICGAEPEGNALVLTMAGMIGLCGVTAGGLGLCVNTLAQLRSNPEGLPVAFVARTALAQADRAGAVRFLARVPHASGQNYILADRTGVTDLECSAAGATEYRVPGIRNMVWHANHPLASSDLQTDRAVVDDVNSMCRGDTLSRLLGEGDRLPGIDQVKAVLANRDHGEHPISRQRSEQSRFFTFAGVIWSIGPDPVAEVAPGPPSSVPFRTYRL